MNIAQTPPPLIPPAAPNLSAEPRDKGEEKPPDCAAASDLFSASVSELRRKAQEHSAALWQLAQTVQQQQQSSSSSSNNNNNNNDVVTDTDESDVRRNSEEEEEGEDDGNGAGDEKGTSK